MLEMDKDELINKPHNILHPAGEEFMKTARFKECDSLTDKQILETKIITKTWSHKRC